ncbi:glutation S-transferase [Westerdykella ornata]|uniref:Glutation S-transferase n=1 Tax=Westerdykella ornata TaxID=318751 RepID=A0A6A6JQI7_WESOR|nr:glutation S-transferase [Westerdykella ornata]KAF2277946.1 glutation S-transferase [Westerdykella ornata]
MATIQLPAEYGYTLAAAVSTFFVGSWLGIRVTKFRKAARIPYPYEYASYEQVTSASPAQSKAMDTFNRAQRGHQNFLENQGSAVGAMLIAGLRYPVASAVLGGIWSLGRVVYAWGYTSGGEKGRYRGIFGQLAQYVLYGFAVKSVWDVVSGA